MGVEGLGTCPGPWGGPEPGHTVKARTEEVREGAVWGSWERVLQVEAQEL